MPRKLTSARSAFEETACRMSSSRETYYDALEATTNIEDMTGDEGNQDILRSLRDDRLSSLIICQGEYLYGLEGEYILSQSKDLGWLGHFAKKSSRLEEFCIRGSDAFGNCSEQSVNKFLEDIGRCGHIKRLDFSHRNDLNGIMHKLEPAIKNNNITHWSTDGCYMGESEANRIFNAFHGEMKGMEELSIAFKYEDERDLNDGVMADCIPSLAACISFVGWPSASIFVN